MEQPSCIRLFFNLSTSIDKINYDVIDHMTDSDMMYNWACIKPNLSYDYFFSRMKTEWENIVSNHVSDNSDCSSSLNRLLSLTHLEEIKTKIESGGIDDLVLESIASFIVNSDTNHFTLDKNFSKSLFELISLLRRHCSCQIPLIFKYVTTKYLTKYKNQFKGLTVGDAKTKLKEELNKFKTYLSTLDQQAVETNQTAITKNIANRLTGLYEFSMEHELNTLIPESLGSLKRFFIKVISTYYNNLHPVVWAQIIKQMVNNVFVDLPFSTTEWFAFSSKYVLLNSGPFILKILQMIRPFLSTELAAKYNLTKLTYPQLTSDQVNNVLRKVVNGWNMYNIITNVTASVGHVCIVNRTDRPDDVFIIKIIKPLSIVQSCWEYKTLYNLFPENTCESDFVRNMLESNGRELNVNGEISNLSKGHEYYTSDYRTIIGENINATLTAVQNKPGIIDNSKCWYALTMTLAPGVPLSYLVERDMLLKDTHYRAKLHRCLDLLIYKFFSTIVQYGFYHGDLHAGNIFFSFEQEQMTLIDFGAVGEIDLFSKDQSIRDLLEIIIMSVFYNYDDMFDKMTTLLNTKCNGKDLIDMKSDPYIQMRKVLTEIKEHNIRNHAIEKQNTDEYKEGIFSSKRISDENNYPRTNKHNRFVSRESIYSYLEYERKGREDVSLNTQELPQFSKQNKPVTIGFAKILESIFTFYASNGTNVAIKFSEFYEFQKAYGLLLGVLHKTGYSPFRTNIVIRKSIVNWSTLLPKITHVDTITHLIQVYWRESNKYIEPSV